MSDEFIGKLESFDRILLSTHEQPDADGIGSVLGLAWHLHTLGKETRIIVTPKLPDFLKFLDIKEWVECFDRNLHKSIAAWPDCWVLADANELSRLGPLKDSFLVTRASKACIDHHLPSYDTKAFDFISSNPNASSTCELVLRALGFPKDFSSEMPVAMAQALYAGLTDDTGGFRFSNTTPIVFKMAAALLERGVKPDVVYRGLHNHGTLAKMRITGIAFKGMRLYCDERLAVMTVSLADMESVDAAYEDLDGLVNKPMELRVVEVSVLVYEKPDGQVKVSMRSKSGFDVNVVCRLFGGGGHRLASGVNLPGPIASVLNDIIPVIIARIERDVEQ